MKTRFLLLLMGLCLASFSSLAQNSDLLQFNQERLKVNKTAMTVLGSWAVANIGVGAALAGSSDGSAKHFHQMNVGWNVVNLGIAAFGYFQTRKAEPSSMTLQESIDESYSMQKVVLFNAGLDVAYIAAGAYLIEKGKNADENADLWKGFGQSIALQGGFLLLFDIGFHSFLASKNKKLKSLMENVSLSGNGIGLKVVIGR